MMASTESSSSTDMQVGPGKLTHEEYILWFLQQKGGRVSYCRYEPQQPDLGQTTDIAQVFGRTDEEAEALHQAVINLEEAGEASVQRYQVQQAVEGSKGKHYSDKFRYVVEQR